ncbi:MAG TPA: hypothetical protein VG406_13010 [Isosphaeraceae bacterium]|jgi:hypothetical protein|nr:hypothetical protein [Isosphaeraceae bacterium]
MKRYIKLFTFLSLLFAILLLLAGLMAHGGRAATRETRPVGVRLSPGSMDVGTLEARQTLTLKFELVNATDSPIRVLGSSGRCNRVACLDAGPGELPCSIPGASSRNIEVTLAVSNPGVFAHEITLYTDCPGQPEVGLVVSGIVVERIGSM